MLSAALALLMVLGMTVRPLRQITRAVEQVAGGDLLTEVPSLGQKDEIGKLAGALEKFKEAGLDNQRLQAEQKEVERRVELERKKVLGEMADPSRRASTAWRRACRRRPGTCSLPRRQCRARRRRRSAGRRRRRPRAGLDQRADGRQRRRGINLVDRRDRPSGHGGHPDRGQGGRGCRPDQRQGPGPGRGGAEDRRRRQADQRYRRSDEPPGPQRHHRSGAAGEAGKGSPSWRPK